MLHQYKRAAEAVHLVYHFLLMAFIESLHHMGWSDINPTLGFKIPDNPNGVATKAGTMPHWLVSFSTFLACWGNWMMLIDARGGDRAMRDAMSSLQHIVTGMMQGAMDPDGTWLMAAHLIMARVHKLCVSLRPDVIGAELTLQEEREASNRARSVSSAKRSVSEDYHGAAAASSVVDPLRRTCAPTTQLGVTLCFNASVSKSWPSSSTEVASHLTVRVSRISRHSLLKE